MSEATENQRSDTRIFLGLPAFNEFAAIRPLFEKIRNADEELRQSELYRPIHVIIYDDGSTDGTGAEVRRQASGLQVTLLTPDINYGLGSALQGIINFFLRIGNESDVLVIMDCDDTHDPRQIVDLLSRMNTAGDDIVIASRYRKGAVIAGVPLSRQILSLGFAILVKAVLPIKGVRDYSCGYRSYSYATLKGVSEADHFYLQEPGFSAMPEILIRLRGRGLQFGEIPLHLAYDQRQTESKMRAWKNSKRLLRCLILWRLARPSASKGALHEVPTIDDINIQHIN